MKYPYYKNLETSCDYTTFDFVSTGSKGDIYKRITFRKIQEPNIYNLALGDLINGQINYYVISNNQDMPMVLATVAFAAGEFLTNYPEGYIFLAGNSIERTRLYRMAIGNNLEYLSKIFNIWGIQKDGSPRVFTKDCRCRAFLIQKKTNKFDLMKKETKYVTSRNRLFPPVRLKVNPKLDNVNPLGNPEKMEDARRILSNLKGPLPWDKK